MSATPSDGGASDDTDRTPVEGAEVCVVGAGPGGALLAHRLAKRGHEVVVIEAGPTFDKESRVDRMKRDIRPKDFEMDSRYGVGKDWPISYEDVRPYYAEVEQEIGVSGPDDTIHGPPREAEYPMDPYPPSYPDKLFTRAGEKLGYDVERGAYAINTGAYDRNECQGYGTCQHVCPSGAKYSADIHVEKAISEGATVIDEAPVQRLNHGPDGEEITEAVYKTPDGETHRQTADVFVAAAGAYETPRLLFLSESAEHPNGLANSSGTLGRYFMGHPPASVIGILPGEETYPGQFGPTFSSGIAQFMDGEGERGGVNIGILNDPGPSPASIAMSDVGIGDALLETVDTQYGSAVGTFMNCEMLPRAENRITLDESTTDDNDNPVLDLQLSPGEYARKAQEKGIAVSSELVEEMGGNVLYGEGTQTMEHDDLPPLAKGGYHPMGGTRMGEDPTESVVDPNLRTHDLENLYVSSGGTFVTVGASNPTMTIMALSLRLADHIHEVQAS
ncbi:GMC family oxidoreductase [Halobacteriales archaeon QH_10_67_22]|nr:MAG: GMC family oxidoreductase [Halobacteriales archaeon QH_10_67_22]